MEWRSTCLLLLISPYAWSQASAGAVSGTLRDRTNSVIPNAAVVLVNAATNVRSAATTPLIPWGSTTLPVNAPSNHPWRNQPLPNTRRFGPEAPLYQNVSFRRRLNLRAGAGFFNVFNHPGNPTGVSRGILARRNAGVNARTLRQSW